MNQQKRILLKRSFFLFLLLMALPVLAVQIRPVGEWFDLIGKEEVLATEELKAAQETFFQKCLKKLEEKHALLFLNTVIEKNEKEHAFTRFMLVQHKTSRQIGFVMFEITFEAKPNNIVLQGCRAVFYGFLSPQ